MKPLPFRRFSRRTLWMIGMLALLAAAAAAVVVAVYRGTAPARAERALVHASLLELQYQSQVDPGNPRVFYHLGERALQTRNRDLALTSFRQAAVLAPHDEGIWLTWARAVAAIRGSGAALDVLDTFLVVHPRSLGAHLMKAQILAQLGQSSDALAEAGAAAKQDPSNERAWRLTGVAALATHKWGPAEDAFRHAVALAPGSWEDQHGLGDALLSDTRYRDSLPYLREAVRLAPSMSLTHLTLGVALLHTAGSPAEYETARVSLRKALAARSGLTPEGQFLLLVSMGQSYSAEGRWQEALTWLQRAAPYEPANVTIVPDLHYELARAYRGIHQPADAEREMRIHSGRLKSTVAIQRAFDDIAVHPADAQPYLRLARLYRATGDVADAADNYRMALARDPGLKAAQQEFDALLRRQPATGRESRRVNPSR